MVKIKVKMRFFDLNNHDIIILRNNVSFSFKIKAAVDGKKNRKKNRRI